MLDVLQSPEGGTDSDVMKESLQIEETEVCRTLAEREREIVQLLFGLTTNLPSACIKLVRKLT